MPKESQSPSSEVLLARATKGFDQIFLNDVPGARQTFQAAVGGTSNPSPFDHLGLGVAAFLEAALGLEREKMEDAAKALAAAVESTGKASKPAKGWISNGESVLEYEILNADAVVLEGICNALSESYMGYLSCIYALNSAHSKFTKLYKTVFPEGIDAYPVSPSISRKSSTSTLSIQPGSGATTPSSISSEASASSITTTTASSKKSKSSSLLGKWGASSEKSSSSSSLAVPNAKGPKMEEGPVQDMIVAGTAFGFGLFNLVFSLLPKRIQSVVGFFGFKHDRKLALRSLARAAALNDVHSVFAGLVLMTYYGVVLLLSGWQHDEAGIMALYEQIVTRVEGRYPGGSLWVLNRAKFKRMGGHAAEAIRVLKAGLDVPEEEGPVLQHRRYGTTSGPSTTTAPTTSSTAPTTTPSTTTTTPTTTDAVDAIPIDAPHQRWQQADTLLVFELAWTLLGERRYEEAAGWFVRMTELNGWSHATYYFIACGCWSAVAIGVGGEDDIDPVERRHARDKARELWEKIPGLLEKNGRKMGGKELPVEVLIRKKLDFYKEKHARRGGDIVDCFKISPAEEMAVFWNTHQRISIPVAEAHIREWASLTPRPAIKCATIDRLLASSSTISTTTTDPTSTPTDSATTTTPTDSTPTPATATATATATEPAPTSTHMDLDTPDELAIRALLLGIVLRTVGDFEGSRAFLKESSRLGEGLKEVVGAGGGAGVGGYKGSTWVRGVALFEEGVTVLKEEAANDATGARTAAARKSAWGASMKSVAGLLDKAMAASPNSIDLSSRLDSRVAMLRDEMEGMREGLGL